MAGPSPVVQDLETAISAMKLRPLALALGLLLTAPLVSGCASSYIPNTTVEDTSENRKIIGVCEKYRNAVEGRDVDTVVSMAHPSYFETGGNAKASDDIDYNGLRAYLTEKFKHTKQIRYEIKYHRVSETENKVILVEFTYTASFQIPTATGDMWHRAVRDNQLQLIRDPKSDSFRILRGM
jgi:hypothetical protein